MRRHTNPTSEIISEIVKRPQMDLTALSSTIEEIFNQIEINGDQAVLDYTEKFDKIALDHLAVLEAEVEGARNSIPLALKSAIQTAYSNITSFHESQQSDLIKVETIPGVTCWRKSIPIDKVGIYIPGGTAPLFSTVLMLAIPAQLAGCEEIVLCTPPNSYGIIHPAILYTADLCGIDKIFKVGGAQAIAAMSTGTPSIPKVYKVFGPGNQYVTAAKMKAFEKGTAIDMPAGPSEVLVYADETAQASFVASDLLAQAEHGVDSQVILVATTEAMIDNVMTEIERQIDRLPRKEIAKLALEHSHVVHINGKLEAFKFINNYAPEHLIIASDKASTYVDMIRNAGSVFLGNYTPESAGDYASGTNHTLPTNGHAKAFSGVSLDSFVKKITFQEISKAGIENLGGSIITMAEEEKLQAHANSVKVRLEL